MLNELAIHSGGRDSITVTLDCYVDGTFLTTCIGDGIIACTATGSTAYSMACGGSVVHPLCDSLCVTPIAPRSLSFRPILLPGKTELDIIVSKNNRNDNLMASFDGRHSFDFKRAHMARVSMSSFPAHIISRADPMEDWIAAIKERLNWNA